MVVLIDIIRIDNRNNVLLRFLQGNQYDCDKTLNCILEHLLWRIDNLPVPIEEVDSYIKQGLLYIFGRDKSYRPILHASVKKICDSEISEEALIRLATFLIEHIIEHLLIPGKVETIVMLVDLSGVSSFSFPVNKFKNVARLLGRNYQGRLYKQFALNVSVVFRRLWDVSKHFFSSFTIASTFLLGGNFNELYKLIPKSELEKKFGGYCQNLGPYYKLN